MIHLSVAIPTYGRDEILTASLDALLALNPPPEELLLIDQTPQHDDTTEQRLRGWAEEGRLRWIRLETPSIPMAMNRALLLARGTRVLFLDDDIEPDAQLLSAHLHAGDAHPHTLIAGRVLQPWHHSQPDPENAPFRFNTLRSRPVTEFMGGNFSVPRAEALEIGGFDENFRRVAFRFEAEFAHRWRLHGFPIRYVPEALIRHLQAPRGGTRSFGRHLVTIRPDHAVGAHYYHLRTRRILSALCHCLQTILRAVITRHHLRHPWWIPVGLVAQLRGFFWALRLHIRGPRLLHPQAESVPQGVDAGQSFWRQRGPS